MDWLELVEVIVAVLFAVSSVRAWMLERGNETRLAALEALAAHYDEAEITRRIDGLFDAHANLRERQAVVEVKLDAYEATDDPKPETAKE